jgi:hypothetical protein
VRGSNRRSYRVAGQTWVRREYNNEVIVEKEEELAKT